VRAASCAATLRIASTGCGRTHRRGSTPGSALIATVPRRVAEQIAANAAIAITPLPIDFATSVSMAWHRRAAADPAETWFRALLTDAAGE
jgi:DNA-binding transcriptional LysR family regulator